MKILGAMTLLIGNVWTPSVRARDDVGSCDPQACLTATAGDVDDRRARAEEPVRHPPWARPGA